MQQITPPLTVANPCHVEWAAMIGDERKRFCSECGKHVHNLSAMTASEAQKFADETQGRECVAYIRAGEGLMQSPNFIERLILRIVGWTPAFAKVLVAILPAALASCVNNRPTGGVPTPPGKSIVPRHQSDFLLGDPIPGSPTMTLGESSPPIK